MLKYSRYIVCMLHERPELITGLINGHHWLWNSLQVYSLHVAKNAQGLYQDKATVIIDYGTVYLQVNYTAEHDQKAKVMVD